MPEAPPTVCVVGGGFTGAAAAIACLSRIKAPFRLTMIEGTASLGAALPMAAITRSIFSMCAPAISRFAQGNRAIS
jgi:NADPH-dependent 2,4-dienoyl-CoA reductase/sulfur reductase-like enzyme